MSKLYTSVAAIVFAATVTNGVALAAVVKDHKCTHRDGSEYQCSAGIFARNEHIKACGKEWKANTDASVKADGWPHFWSVCSQRMKQQSATK